MKRNYYIGRIIVLLLFALLFLPKTTKALYSSVGFGWFDGYVLGDFAENDYNNTSAGFASQCKGPYFELSTALLPYLSLDVKLSYKYYPRDNNLYSKALDASLLTNSNNSTKYLDDNYSSFSYYLGLSLEVPISETMNLIPYFFVGNKNFSSPSDKVIYYKNNTTTTYIKRAGKCSGLAFMPGFKLIINTMSPVSLYIFAEYETTMLNDLTEEEIKFTNDTFQKAYLQKQYNPQVINFGLGILINLTVNIRHQHRR